MIISRATLFYDFGQDAHDPVFLPFRIKLSIVSQDRYYMDNVGKVERITVTEKNRLQESTVAPTHYPLAVFRRDRIFIAVKLRLIFF
jgi:hypothetical protein